MPALGREGRIKFNIAACPSRIPTVLRRPLALACMLIFSALWPGQAGAGERDACDAATPLRVANLDPFHLVYGIPGSYGACVLQPGASELIASMDIASHMNGTRSSSERLSIDGETYRQALALRHGFRDGWEAMLEISVVSHAPGVFDGFIENWHSFFGLPQGGRDTAPRDQLAIRYNRDGRARVDLDDGVSSLGDIALGVGHEIERNFLSNDGLAIRGIVKLPTGDEDALAGAGGVSASIWAETSGKLFGSGGAWLYGATLGALAGSTPESLSGIGTRIVAFGRLGVTWRPLARLALTTQVDVNSSPYSSSLAPLAGPVVMIGVGGRLKLTPNTLLEIAIAEDDGSRRAAADFGVHAAIRWRP